MKAYSFCVFLLIYLLTLIFSSEEGDEVFICTDDFCESLTELYLLTKNFFKGVNMFSSNSGFNKFMTKIFDFIGLNIIFFLLCLPIITIGASMAAMYGVTIKMANKEDLYPFKVFFEVFIKNFFKATVIWLILLGISGILYYNYMLVQDMNSLVTFMNPLIVFFLIFTLIYTIFVFPILIKFPNRLLITLKNTFLMVFGFLPHAILIALLMCGPTLAMILWFPSYSPYLLYFYLIIGISYTFHISSYILNHMFNKVIEGTRQQELS